MELVKALNSEEDEVIRVSEGATVLVDKVLTHFNEKFEFMLF